MTAMRAAAAHSGRIVQQMMAAPPLMAIVAAHLARRVMRPPSSQLRRLGPKTRCASSQACRRGELRVAAQAAPITNTVVGMPGRITPITASTMHSTASAP